MGSRRIRVRPPGVKPWTRIGPLGPFRGRLGLAWVIAPLVLGVILLAAVWLLLVRHPAPGGTFRAVGAEATFVEGRPRAIGGGVFIARSGDQLFAVASDPGCPIEVAGAGYLDCRGVSYGPDGQGAGGSLDLVPILVHDGTVYADPAHPVPRPAGSA